MVSKRKLIDDVYNIAAYSIMYNYSNVLGRRASYPGVIKQVSLVRQEAKSNIDRYFEIIGERIDSALHTGIIIQRVPVKITKLRGIPFQSGASNRSSDIDFYQGGFLESD